MHSARLSDNPKNGPVQTPYDSLMRFFQLGLKVAKLLRAMLEATREECFGIALRKVRRSKDGFVYPVAMVAYVRKVDETAPGRVGQIYLGRK